MTLSLKNGVGTEGTDENSRIRIHWSEVWIRGSGSIPKFHISATLGGGYESAIPNKGSEKTNY
jgi:hypothetical protein